MATLKLPALRFGALALNSVVPASNVAEVPSDDALLSPFPFPLPLYPLSDFDLHYHLTLDYRWILSGFHPLAIVASGGGGSFRRRRPRYRDRLRFRNLSLQRPAVVDLLRRPPCRQSHCSQNQERICVATSWCQVSREPTSNLLDRLLRSTGSDKGFLSNSLGEARVVQLFV